ncbi:arsenical resistance operon transcriptional repressor ArsD [Virgibacillus phasianinus]|uniref:Arsenical resistance operon transcriptional repressor ArsD n=1 Tax=Virgibacillus phasianinus TaxID=2017483 RepID=A0A220TZU9_9BACI|nr:arsenite efflux transporter metallochaperone ArsD [Virgibacillus phasianinus]ASK61378.1 arsenical resistance operon transcriptional repressor ArsD [Virgibacillus phasianinus]
MSKLEIFDPAMCCSTGVCGPSVDPDLTRVASVVYSLEKRGFDVTRFNLSNDPGEFVENKKVNQVLQEKGADALPVTILNGEIVKDSSYPSNEEFSDWLQVDAADLKDKPQTRVTIDIDKL